jgi:hypothetical protein
MGLAGRTLQRTRADANRVFVALSVAGLIGVAACTGSDSTTSESVSEATTVPAVSPPVSAVLDPASSPPSSTPNVISSSPEKQALVDSLPLDADCSGVAPDELPTPASDEEVLTVMRVDAGCLRYESTVVPSAEFDARAAEARSRVDVVAADRPTVVDVLSAEEAPRGIDAPIPEQQWWLEDLGIADLDNDVRPNTAVPKVRVAVIDNGIASHRDLDGVVIEHRSLLEPGRDGSIDSHGTRVAGIIGARADNHEFGRGVATYVELLDVPEAASLAQLITWSVDHGARVINMSVLERGLDGVALRAPNDLTQWAIYSARSHALLVAAAGNCGTAPSASKCRGETNAVLYPAAYEGVLGVGAYGSDPDAPGDLHSRVAAFSTRNWTVDISAPGDDISSTAFTAPPAAPTVSPDNGTSFAAPMVSAAAAVLFAHRPDAPPDQVEAALLATARPAGGTRTDEYGHGRLDPVAAAGELDRIAAAPPLTLAALQNARVPSLCEFPPGLLVQGALRSIAPSDGGVGMDDRIPLAVGDVNGDGLPDAAAVVGCTHGGVSWPEQIVIYTTGNLLVGSVDLGSLTEGAARATVESMTYVDGRFDVAWWTNQAGDLDCCPTRYVGASISIVNAAVTVSPVIDLPPPQQQPVTLTTCEGVDLTPVADFGAFVGISQSTCAAPWALVAFTEADPSVSVALVRYDDTGHSELVEVWGDLQLGDNPTYTPATIAAQGVPLEIATAMYTQLGGPSAGNQSGVSCTSAAFAADTGVSTETANCADGWGVGVPTDCGDQCEHFEVFQQQDGRWIAKGGFASFCPDALATSGMPIEVANELTPAVLCQPAGSNGSTELLQFGDDGPAVVSLQQALVAAGYAEVAVDGTFGRGTQNAVRAYQAQAGLEPDGIAGPATLRALGLIP